MRDRHKGYALVYAMLLPQLQLIAKEHGYALGVHGSMSTDLDLIAVPWIEEAQPAEKLVEAIKDYLGLFAHMYKGDGNGGSIENPSQKPHGRVAWALHQKDAGGPYLDLSVMPLNAHKERV